MHILKNKYVSITFYYWCVRSGHVGTQSWSFKSYLEVVGVFPSEKSEGVPFDFYDWEVGISQFRVQLQHSISKAIDTKKKNFNFFTVCNLVNLENLVCVCVCVLLLFNQTS